MTGFGQASAELPEARVTVELRSLNHRFADLRMRLPDGLAAIEFELRRQVLARIRRGRVEMTVGVESLAGPHAPPALNRAFLEEVLNARQLLADEYQLESDVGVATALAIPGMFRSRISDFDWSDERIELLRETVGAALDALLDERRREGRHLQQELRQRIGTMKKLADELEQRAAEIPEMLRDKLLRRLDELTGDVALDPARVAQEAAVLADRSDVTEELTRLAGHLAQAEKLVSEPDDDPLGKRLDFLSQEIHRETNTIGSKSSDLQVTRHALALKNEVEKLREQIHNIE